MNVELLIEYRKKGLSWDYIAEELGVTQYQMRKFRMENNYPPEEPYYSNGNRKSCIRCGHKILKENLRYLVGRGKFCEVCYKKELEQ